MYAGISVGNVCAPNKSSDSMMQCAASPDTFHYEHGSEPDKGERGEQQIEEQN